jgi:hypothetical protein
MPEELGTGTILAFLFCGASAPFPRPAQDLPPAQAILSYRRSSSSTNSALHGQYCPRARHV